MKKTVKLRIILAENRRYKENPGSFYISLHSINILDALWSCPNPGLAPSAERSGDFELSSQVLWKAGETGIEQPERLMLSAVSLACGQQALSRKFPLWESA